MRPDRHQSLQLQDYHPSSKGAAGISGVSLPSPCFLLRVTQVLVQNFSSTGLCNLGPLQRKLEKISKNQVACSVTAFLVTALQPIFRTHIQKELHTTFLGMGAVSAL